MDKNVLQTGTASELDTRVLQPDPQIAHAANIPVTLTDSREVTNEQRYRALLSGLSTFVWVADAKGRFTVPQPGWEAYTGHGFAQHCGDGWMADMHPDDRARVAEVWKQAVQSKSWYEVAWRCWHGATQSWRQCITRAVPVTASDGSVLEWIGAVQDIEDRVDAELKRLQSELAARTAELDQTFNSAAVGLTRCSRDLRYITANPAYAHIAGVPLERIIGKPIAEVMGAQGLAAILPYIERVLDGESVQYESSVPFSIGGERVLAVDYTPWKESDGSVSGWMATVRDVTERRRAEDEAKAASRSLAAALGSMSDAVFISGSVGNLQHVNQAFASYHRFKSEEECSKHITDCPRLLEASHSDGTPAPLDEWALPRALRGERRSNVIYRLRRKDTGESWVGNYSFGPIQAEDGSITGAVVVARDVTQASQVEEALRASEERLRLAAEIAQMGAFDLDLRTGVSKWTPELEAMHGLARGEFGGTHAAWEALVHPEDRPAAVARVKETLETGQAVECEWRVIWPDGSGHWLAARMQALKDDQGTPIRLIGVNLDITARKNYEQALEKADRLKDEFLAMLAHELRNPLAPIRNATEILKRLVGSDERTQAALRMLSRQTAQLTRLVDDLLDVSRITRGHITLAREVIEISRIIDQAGEAVQPLIREKGHHISIERPLEPIFVDGDATRLTQVLSNVLTNAAKYTDPNGYIRIGASVTEDEVDLHVTDNGCGISPNLLPHVFDLFVQSERTLDRSQGGLGVGLAVVKRLVELHGGSVSAQSAGLGSGTTVSIRLPRARPADVPEVSAAPLKVARRRVLVIDDNRDGADSLGALLRLQGHEVEAVYSAQAGLEAAQRLKPDVAVVDIGLPHMDGYELARRLRSIESLRHTKLLALTGYGQSQDRERALAAGFDAHLVKPAKLDDLERLLVGSRTTVSLHVVPAPDPARVVKLGEDSSSNPERDRGGS